MDLKLLIAQLKALKVAERRLLARRAKVGYTTINNILYKTTGNPGFKTLTKLERAMK